jgi:hypothetical protein
MKRVTDTNTTCKDPTMKHLFPLLNAALHELYIKRKYIPTKQKDKKNIENINLVKYRDT